MDQMLDLQSITKNIKQIKSQIQLLQMFVGDLQDMRQLADGVFLLTEQLFNPN